jgi:hypothetical protein
MIWPLALLGGTTLVGAAISGYLVLVNRTLRAALAAAGSRQAETDALLERERSAVKVARDKLVDAQRELAAQDERRAREVLSGADPAAGVVDLLNGLPAGPRDPSTGRR